jgi:hypothetical protein
VYTEIDRRAVLEAHRKARQDAIAANMELLAKMEAKKLAAAGGATITTDGSSAAAAEFTSADQAQLDAIMHEIDLAEVDPSLDEQERIISEAAAAEVAREKKRARKAAAKAAEARERQLDTAAANSKLVNDIFRRASVDSTASKQTDGEAADPARAASAATNGFMREEGDEAFVTLSTDLTQVIVSKKKKKTASKKKRVVKLQQAAHNSLAKVLIGAFGDIGLTMDVEGAQFFSLMNLKEDLRGTPSTSHHPSRTTSSKPVPKFLHHGYQPADYAELFRTLGEQETGPAMIVKLMVEGGGHTSEEIIHLLTDANCGGMDVERATALLQQVRETLAEAVDEERVGKLKKHRKHAHVASVTGSSVIDAIISIGVHKAKQAGAGERVDWMAMARAVKEQSSITGVVALLGHLSKSGIAVKGIAKSLGIKKSLLTGLNVVHRVTTTKYGQRILRKRRRERRQREHARKRAAGIPCSDTESDSDTDSEDDGTAVVDDEEDVDENRFEEDPAHPEGKRRTRKSKLVRKKRRQAKKAARRDNQVPSEGESEDLDEYEDAAPNAEPSSASDDATPEKRTKSKHASKKSIHARHASRAFMGSISSVLSEKWRPDGTVEPTPASSPTAKRRTRSKAEPHDASAEGGAHATHPQERTDSISSDAAPTLPTVDAAAISPRPHSSVSRSASVGESSSSSSAFVSSHDDLLVSGSEWSLGSSPDGSRPDTRVSMHTRCHSSASMGAVRPILAIRPLSASSTGELDHSSIALRKAQRKMREAVASETAQAAFAERIMRVHLRKSSATAHRQWRHGSMELSETARAELMRESAALERQTALADHRRIVVERRAAKLTNVERRMRAQITRILVDHTSGKKSVAFARKTNFSSKHFFGEESSLPPGCVYDVYSSEGPVGIGVMVPAASSAASSPPLAEELLENDGFVSHRRVHLGDTFYPRTAADRQHADLAAGARELTSQAVGLPLPLHSPAQRMMVSRVLKSVDSQHGGVRKHVFVAVHDIWGIHAYRHAPLDKRHQVVDWSRVIEAQEQAAAKEAARLAAPPNPLQQAINDAATEQEPVEAQTTFITMPVASTDPPERPTEDTPSLTSDAPASSVAASAPAPSLASLIRIPDRAPVRMVTPAGIHPKATITVTPDAPMRQLARTVDSQDTLVQRVEQEVTFIRGKPNSTSAGRSASSRPISAFGVTTMPRWYDDDLAGELDERTEPGGDRLMGGWEEGETRQATESQPHRSSGIQLPAGLMLRSAAAAPESTPTLAQPAPATLERIDWFQAVVSGKPPASTGQLNRHAALPALPRRSPQPQPQHASTDAVHTEKPQTNRAGKDRRRGPQQLPALARSHSSSASPPTRPAREELQPFMADSDLDRTAFLTAIEDEQLDVREEKEPIPPHMLSPPKVRAHTGLSGGNYGSPGGKRPPNKRVALLPSSELVDTPSYEQQLAATRAQMRRMLEQSHRPMGRRRPERRVMAKSASSPLIVAAGSKYLSAVAPSFKSALAPLSLTQQLKSPLR